MRRIVAASVVGAVLWGAACSSSSGGGAASAPDASIAAEAGPVLPVPTSTDPKVLAGYQAALTRDCASCHQPSDPTLGVLSGQDTVVPGTSAYGANLTPDPDTGMDAWTSAQIATALRMGLDDTGAELCPAMPTYPTMSDTEADDIAAYLQNLTAVHNLIPASMCPPIKPPPAMDDGGDDGDDGAASDGAADDGG